MLPPLTLQYADFAAWQRRNLQGERSEKLLAYWRRELEELPTLALTTNFPRPNELDLRGDVLTFTVPAELTASLQSLARLHSCTPFMLLLSAFQVLLLRYTGQTDFGSARRLQVATTPVSTASSASSSTHGACVLE